MRSFRILDLVLCLFVLAIVLFAANPSLACPPVVAQQQAFVAQPVYANPVFAQMVVAQPYVAAQMVAPVQFAPVIAQQQVQYSTANVAVQAVAVPRFQKSVTTIRNSNRLGLTLPGLGRTQRSTVIQRNIVR